MHPKIFMKNKEKFGIENIKNITNSNKIQKLLRKISYKIVTDLQFRIQFYTRNFHLMILEQIERLFNNSTHNNKHCITTDLQINSYITTVKYIFLHMENINEYKAFILNILDKTVSHKGKIEILKLMNLRSADLNLSYEFFEHFFLHLPRITNNEFSSLRESKLHVITIELMIKHLNNQSIFKHNLLLVYIDSFDVEIIKKFIILYSKWYFMQNNDCKHTQKIVSYQEIKDMKENLSTTNLLKKQKNNLHEKNLILLIQKTIYSADDEIFKILRQLLQKDNNIHKYLNVEKLRGFFLLNISSELLFCIYELCKNNHFNRIYLRDHMIGVVIYFIRKKMQSIQIDFKLLGSLMLYDIFMPEITTSIENELNIPIMEICLLILEKNSDILEMDKYILRIISKLMLRDSKYKIIFIEKNGFKLIKNRINKFEKEVLLVCLNYSYNSTSSEKLHFLREIPKEYASSILKAPKYENIEIIFGIFRNMLCCSESVQKIIFQYFSIQNEPSKFICVLGHYFNYFINSKQEHRLIILNIIYTMVNISISSFPEIYNFLKYDFYKAIDRFNDPEIALAIVWLLINLTWKVRNEKIDDLLKYSKIIHSLIKSINKNGMIPNEQLNTLEENLNKLESNQ